MWIQLRRDVVAEDLKSEVLLCDTARAVVHRVPTADAPWVSGLAAGVEVEVVDGTLVRQLIDAGLVEQATGAAGTSRRQIITRTAGAAAAVGVASIVLPSVAAAQSGGGGGGGGEEGGGEEGGGEEPPPQAVTWIASDPAVPAQGWNGVAYGNGIFAAVTNGPGLGDGGTDLNEVITSSDGGATWTRRTITAISGGTVPSLTAITYGNGRFVAVGETGRTMTSTDGLTWNQRRVSPFNYAMEDVTFGNGIFVAVARSAGSGEDKRVHTSSDGIAWTSVAVPTVAWRAVGFGNGTFVAVGDGGSVMTSSDNGPWTSQTGIGTTNWRSVAYGGGVFVAVGAGGAVMTSTDGETWAARAGVGTTNWNGVAHGTPNDVGTFVAISASGAVMASPDGVTWTTRTGVAGTDPLWFGVAYGGGSFVAVGNRAAMYSPA